MSGMTTTGTIGITDYGSRTVAISVTGVCRQDVMKTSNYTVKVPYSRMAQTIQGIARMGGKVAGVSLLPSSNSDVQAEQPIQAATKPEAKEEKAPVKKGRGRRGRKKK